MDQKKTPGVYIVEEPAFPNSVVEVPTGIPAFLGYTEQAMDGTTSIAGVPTRVTSMSEFEHLFGYGPTRTYTRTNTAGVVTFANAAKDFYLYHSLQLYFNNGGGPCWIVSVASYATAKHSASEFTDDIWKALAKISEPSMYVVPDAVALSRADYKAVCDASFKQCTTLANRVALFDIYDGGVGSQIADVIDGTTSGQEGFRNLISFPDEPSYGMAYYPWLNTNIIDASAIDYTHLDTASIAALEKEMAAATATPTPATLLSNMTDKSVTGTAVTRTHNALMSVSKIYQDAMTGLLAAVNVLPPAAAMAGVFARTDASRGVFKAPANTGVVSVLSPTVAISDQQQEDLNVPMFGQAVNAIRAFPGRGVLVWGARTLDGNSQDYRYINVRRTLIMLEQSVFFAAQAYVFEPNVAGTWSAVKTMLENFLNNQWKAGALAGSTPKEAYDVNVGLGTTMTGVDVLDGYMRITVHVAISRPAEFIVITFQQKMQTS